mmetsp:Transcript_50171/g.130631  ORF Transcript_50171/g.130631 Transcript_50171/m.130631 type:complete len:231 (-) Transcript_50171:271-963(-)
MKTMPSCSISVIACRLISSSFRSFSDSSSVKIGTESLRSISRFSVFCRPCIILSKRSTISFIGNWPPLPSSCGLPDFFSGTSISIRRSSRWPMRSSLRKASRLCWMFDGPTRQSRSFSSTLALTLSCMSWSARSLAMLMPTSARSRMIWSTSLPTNPTSVNFVASTLIKGALAILASFRAISVLPTPVGPIMRMFLGMMSSLSGDATRCLRHLLRIATATARFASACPTI